MHPCEIRVGGADDDRVHLLRDEVFDLRLLLGEVEVAGGDGSEDVGLILEQAQEAASFVRALVAGFDKAAAEQVRVLYGGSCKPDNAAELLALPDVDGALVGGASLDPADFTAIVEAAVT